MKIHPLWYVCLFIRFSIIYIIRFFYERKNLKKIFTLILTVMGLGFIYKWITGSNKEIQINKVFWHETRLLHGVLYLLAAYYLFNNNLNMNSLVLFIDIVFSLSYRLL
jgi:hypothetical protein